MLPAALLALAVTTAEAAAPYALLGEAAGKSATLAAHAPLLRIGNAVLANVLTYETRDHEGRSQLILLACDGSWISAPYGVTVQTIPAADYAAIEGDASSKAPPVRSGELRFMAGNRSDEFYGAWLVAKAAGLCAGAAPAPEALVLPIAETVNGNQTIGIGMQARPASTANGRLQMWFRATWFDHVAVPGQRRPSLVASGAYWMSKKELNCRARSAAPRTVDYHDVSPPKQVQTPAAPFLPVIPGTMGDSELALACRLFGN